MRSSAAVLCAALLLAAAPATANLDEPEIEHDADATARGNSTDSGRVAHQRLMLYYQTQPALVRYMMSTLEGRIILYRIWLFRQMYWHPKPPASGSTSTPLPEPQPGDLPAESILDEFDDDGPLPMVGEPGSGTALKAFDEIGASAPPPTSILDEIDDSLKPAVNQAAPPPAQPRQ